ncbi:MAG: hypothetical protein JO130_12965 [Solirubrobacterales bacterium]|nr:hypothetical protein [Solirubrobacterales bacterium]
MGLLDDAIREHLDLKRRRGADPTEIERAEREALGPVRRGPELTGEEQAPIQPSAEAQAEHPDAPSEQWEPFHEDPELQELEEPEEFPPYEPPRAPDGDPLMDDEAAYEEPHGVLEQDPMQSAPSEAEPRPAPHPADPPPAHHDEPLSRVDQETEEYELEPEEQADDDVLESTPEFLQDAPEHDRLWFEQRPPRDFDFDG